MGATNRRGKTPKSGLMNANSANPVNSLIIYITNSKMYTKIITVPIIGVVTVERISILFIVLLCPFTIFQNLLRKIEVIPFVHLHT